MSDRRKPRPVLSVAVGGVIVIAAGCESGDGPKPMDEPLTHQDAMEADARMRGEAGKLLEDRPDLLRTRPPEPRKARKPAEPRRGL